jgi:hypothetical protein
MLSCTSFTPWRNDVVQDALLFLQERKLVCASFPSQWNDVVCDAFVLVHGGIMFEMHLYFCKREI